MFEFGHEDEEEEENEEEEEEERNTDSVVPSGLEDYRAEHPTLKRWAHLVHPAGMDNEILVALSLERPTYIGLQIESLQFAITCNFQSAAKRSFMVRSRMHWGGVLLKGRGVQKKGALEAMSAPLGQEAATRR